MDMRQDSDQRPTMIDRIFNWMESGHWTTKYFAGLLKVAFFMAAVLACLLLLCFTGDDYFKELRNFDKKDL